LPNNQTEYDDVAPDASAMVESMRAYGYNLSTAVADLIDNSIAAECSTIWIETHWAGDDSWISITDDGKGMSVEELRTAMRLGSKNPLDARDKRDLGRFGLGLKTASFSQCRRLTVVTKTESSPTSVRRWDLDHLRRSDVTGWQLLLSMASGSESRVTQLDDLSSGTVVLWEVVDRVVGDTQQSEQHIHDHFLSLIEDLETHLSMIFHRFINRRPHGLKIFINGNSISSWDPFIETHPATQRTPEEVITLPSHDSAILVKGFVLPHKDKLSSPEHKLGSGPGGWNDQQGFYLYRNERLILSGSWLGLGDSRPWTKEEHYKLARIRIDIPNSMDDQWQLDVKKSSATPPPNLRSRLTSLAREVRSDARAVFSHRGKYGPKKKDDEIIRPWKSVRSSGVFRYRIDRNHPFISSIMGEQSGDQKSRTEALLRVLEETVPVEQIWLDSNDNEDKVEGHARPFHGSTSRQKLSTLNLVYMTIRKNRNLTHDEAIQLISTFEGFEDEEFQAIIGALEENL